MPFWQSFCSFKNPFDYHWQLTALLQFFGLIAFIVFLTISRRKEDVDQGTESWPILNLAMLAAAGGALLGLPWVLWGAQGSPLDTLLALFVSTALGFVTALVLVTSIVGPTQDSEGTGKHPGLGGAGWIITLGLIILTAAVDQNGNGWILFFCLLPLGFACAALAYQPDGTISTPGRIAAGVLIMLAFVWPMMMIDPDELSVVISSGTGELLEYAAMGTAISFGLSLLVMIIFLVIRKRLHSKLLPFGVGVFLFVFVWSGVMVLYSFQGQPGFYGEKVFVILKTQADLSTVKNIPIM